MPNGFVVRNDFLGIQREYEQGRAHEQRGDAGKEENFKERVRGTDFAQKEKRVRVLVTGERGQQAQDCHGNLQNTRKNGLPKI